MPRHTGSIGFQGGFGDETPQEYMRSKREMQKECPCSEYQSMKRMLMRLWNPKWGTRDPRKYNAQQIGRGIAVEMEHTKNRDLATEIAMDHLDEFPLYYEWLDLAEKMLREGASAKEAAAWLDLYPFG